MLPALVRMTLLGSSGIASITRLNIEESLCEAFINLFNSLNVDGKLFKCQLQGVGFYVLILAELQRCAATLEGPRPVLVIMGFFPSSPLSHSISHRTLCTSLQHGR